MPTVLLCALRADDKRLNGYVEAAARRRVDVSVVTPEGADPPVVPPFGGVVAVGRRAALLAASLAARLRLPWHDADAVERARDRAYVLGRLTATGMPVPRFAGIEAGTGAGIERVTAIPTPWRVTPHDDGRARIVDSLEALQALAGGMATGASGRLTVEADMGEAAWLVMALLDKGALRVLGIVDASSDDAEGEGVVWTAPASLGRDEQAHLAGLVATGCAALGFRQGPVLARVANINGQACMLDVAPCALDGPASGVLGLVGPSLESVTLEELIVRHAMGESLDGYAMDGTTRTARTVRPADASK